MVCKQNRILIKGTSSEKIQNNRRIQSERENQKSLINYEWDSAATILEMKKLPDFGASDDSVDNNILLLLLFIIYYFFSLSQAYPSR